jgi:hypothetical protein
MKKVLLLLFALGTIGLSTSAQGPTTANLSPQSAGRPVTAEQVNGVYRNGGNEFRILALGHQKLKVQFNGQWMTRWRYPNIGEALGEATIEGNVATFIPGNAPKCKITLTFLSNRVEVSQEGTDADCGFGRNVMATGTYRRIRGGKPRFIPLTK